MRNALKIRQSSELQVGCWVAMSGKSKIDIGPEGAGHDAALILLNPFRVRAIQMGRFLLDVP